jgi:dihydrofolate reductase
VAIKTFSVSFRNIELSSNIMNFQYEGRNKTFMRQTNGRMRLLNYLYSKANTMVRLKFQMMISVDGFIAWPNGEMDWLTWKEDPAMNDYINALTDTTGTILLGRKMTPGFISHWERTEANPADPSRAFAHKMNERPKVVFTRTLQESPWKNTRLAKGDLEEEIKKLKRESEKDLVLYGGASLAGSVIRTGLIDEYHLFVNPVAAGKGMRIFDTLEKPLQFKLIKAIPFSSGIVIHHYEPA